MQQQFWQRIRLIRWSLSLAIVGALLAMFIGLKWQRLELSQPDVAAEAIDDEAKLTLNNFDYRDVKEGNARWTIRAATARYFDDRQETVLDQVSAVFYLKDGGQVNLQGDEGILHNDNKNMEIRGNVRLSYRDDYWLTTERLVYERDRELIHTAAPVLVQGDDLTVKGVGMRFEMSKRTLSILKKVETELEGIVSFAGKRQRTS